MATKMNWLVKQYENKEISYEIQNTKEKMGTIVMPTGAGKSGVMDKDIIYHINNTKGKIIFNISAPILKLCKQQGDDLFNVIENIFVDRCNRDEFMVFINSSADGKVFKDSTRRIGNVRSFTDIEVFEKSEKVKYGIVISCHKSLYKFAERVEYLSKFATVANYLDEGHLLVNLDGRRDFHKEGNFTQKEQKQWGVMQTLCKYSDYLYVLTATPDKTVTALINQAAGNAHGYNIIEISAQELIEKGIILSPRIASAVIDSNSEITANLAEHFMTICKEDSPNIIHKVLITCDNTEHLERLEKELSKKYVVFSTTSKNGAKTNLLEEIDEYDDIEDIDDDNELKSILETNFIKRVDECNEDCFVLHIRQLREGIDIRTLTDCMICNRGSSVNDGEKTKYIQTIGRILRPYKGERPEELLERNLGFEDRTKKHGNVLFVVGNSNIDENGQNICERQMVKFAIKYYGLNGVEAFSLDPNRDYGDIGKTKTAISGWVSGEWAWEDDIESEVKELEVNIIKFMKENVLPMNDWMKSLGCEIKFTDALMQIKHKFGFIDGMNPVCDVISNYELMKMVSKTLAEYGIKA
jgi:superfamily II DNA or RNA helicase